MLLIGFALTMGQQSIQAEETLIESCSIELKSDYDFLIEKLLTKENKLQEKKIEEPQVEEEIKTEEQISEVVISEETEPIIEEPVVSSSAYYSINELEFHGIIYWNDYKFTYYSESVLPGGGLSIEGRHTDSGFVKDLDGYIVLASSYNIPYGTIVETPFGALGKVYDRCPECHDFWFDVYTR